MRQRGAFFLNDIYENGFQKYFESQNTECSNNDEFVYMSGPKEHHLSSVRHNLLKWYPFDSNASLLEIGAEFGAMTGLFCSRVRKVTALESNYNHARIIAERHASYKNLNVITGNINALNTEHKYDYITLIGELELFNKYCGGEKSHDLLLSKIQRILKASGVLILAVNNIIGLDYLYDEEETNLSTKSEPSRYNHLNFLPISFSKKYLGKLLNDSGFSFLEWYYPFPDFKLPQKIFSDYFIPKNSDNVWIFNQNGTQDLRLNDFLSKRQLSKEIFKAGLFSEFANSFLIIAGKKPSTAKSRCLAFIGANTRRFNKFRINASIYEENGKRFIVKNADNDNALPFLEEIDQRDKLVKIFFDGHAKVIEGSFNENKIYYPFLSFPTLESLIRDEIEEGDINFGVKFIKEYIRFVSRLSSKEIIPKKFFKKFDIPTKQITKPVTCLLRAPIDFIPSNILVDRQSWHIIDNEWTYDFPMPVGFLIYRAIYSLIINLQVSIKSKISNGQPAVLFSGYGKNRTYIPYSWLNLMSTIEIPINRLHLWEYYFKRKVLIEYNLGRLRLKRKHKAVRNVTPLLSRIITSLIQRTDSFINKHNNFKEIIKLKLKSILKLLGH